MLFFSFPFVHFWNSRPLRVSGTCKKQESTTYTLYIYVYSYTRRGGSRNNDGYGRREEGSTDFYPLYRTDAGRRTEHRPENTNSLTLLSYDVKITSHLFIEFRIRFVITQNYPNIEQFNRFVRINIMLPNVRKIIETSKMRFLTYLNVTRSYKRELRSKSETLQGVRLKKSQPLRAHSKTLSIIYILQNNVDKKFLIAPHERKNWKTYGITHKPKIDFFYRRSVLWNRVTWDVAIFYGSY